MTTKYQKKLDKIERRVRRWQDQNTGTSSIHLTKSQSIAVLNELCPWCEHDGLCEISEETYGNIYKKCKVKSWELQDTWVRVTDEKSKIYVGNRYGKLVVKNRRLYIAKPFKRGFVYVIVGTIGRCAGKV
jgi:hypothetical protein